MGVVPEVLVEHGEVHVALREEPGNIVRVAAEVLQFLDYDGFQL